MTDLLPLVALGDRAAAKLCIDRYGPLIWSLARRFFADPSDAEDAVQEAFLSIWMHAPTFDPKLSAESTFVAMVARRRFIDSQRRTRRRPRTEPLERATVEPQAEALVEPRLGPAADHGKMRDALDQLRPEVREVLVLTTASGLSHAEVAAKTGLPLGTVKSHARRGLLRLRELLGGES